MSLLTESYFKDVDFDRSKFLDLSASEKSESDIEEEMQFSLEGDMYELDSAVVNLASQVEHAATLKAMLLAQWRIQNARNADDEADALNDFVIFAKSYANVCLKAVRDSVVRG